MNTTINNTEINKEKVNAWLERVFEVAEGLKDLGVALSTFKMMASLEIDSQIANILSILYRKECSGDGEYTFRVRAMYDEITKTSIRF